MGIRHRRRRQIDEEGCCADKCMCCRGCCGGKCTRFLDWIASVLAWVSVIFIIVGIATSWWAVNNIELTPGHEVSISRGLFSIAFRDDDGTTVIIEYHEKDAKGKLDPFCGSNSAESVFSSDLIDYIMRFAAPGVTPSTDLPKDGQLYGPTRDQDFKGWCTTRDAAAGLAITTLVLSIASSVAAFFLGHRFSFLAFLILSVLTVIFGIAATAEFSGWVDDAENAKGYVQHLKAEDGELVLGWSFYLFTVGWLCVFLAAVLDICAWCCSPIDDFHHEDVHMDDHTVV